MLNPVSFSKEIKTLIVAVIIIGLAIIGLLVMALIMSSQINFTTIITTIISSSLNGAFTFLAIRYLSKGLDRIEKQKEKKQ